MVGLLLNQQPTLRDALQMARYAFDFIESVAGAATGPLAAEVRRSIYLLLPLGQATVKQVAESRG